MSWQPLSEAIIEAVRNWPEDLRVAFTERAAIREYDGGQPRQDAERAAYFEVRRTSRRMAGMTP